MGHEIDENEKKTERRKSGSNIKTEVTEQNKGIEIVPRCNTIFGKIPIETFGKNRQTQKILKTMNHGNDQEEDFMQKKRTLTQIP